MQAAYEYNKRRIVETFPTAEVEEIHELYTIAADKLENVELVISQLKERGITRVKLKFIPGRLRVVVASM